MNTIELSQGFLSINGETLNFNPLREKANLICSDWVMLHWNKVTRQAGYYDNKGVYRLINEDMVKPCNCPHQWLKIEVNGSLKPTSVVFYPNAQVIVENDFLEVVNGYTT